MNDMETRTLSDIICDNTVIEKVQERALEIPNPVTNPIRVCSRSARAREPAVSGSAAGTGTGDSGAGPLTTVPNIFLEPTQSPVPRKIQPQQQRVPKSLGPAGFSLNPNFNFESLRPRHSHSASVFPGPVRPPHQSIFDAFRKLQTREFHRIANSSNVKPVKFLERFDHSDAIILHP